MNTEDVPISLTLLGPFGMRVDGHYCLPLPRKAQALIALLALQPARPLARETALDLIWPDGATGCDGTGLRRTLEIIHHLAGAGLVRLTRGALSLRPGSVSVDVREFQALAGSADRRELTRCAALYRGELLENVATVAPRFDEWVAVERIRLSAIAAEAMRRVALSHLEAGEFDAAVTTARRLVALDELRLDSHRLLVTILGSCGRRAEALRHYEMCERVLKSELEIAPDDATLALVARLRAAAPLGPAGRRPAR